MTKTVLGICASVCLLTAAAWGAEARGGMRVLDKKLIEYGWDVPFPDFIRANVREMEERPFDGLIFKLHGGGKVLTPTAWTEAQFAKDYEDVRQIAWEKFTDNFVIMWAASKQDWFDDAHWQAIENNVRLVARGARLAQCVGVCFDQEPYGANPWAYKRAAHAGTKTFQEYEAVVRRRGAQFVRAVESELPKAKILTFFQTSFLRSLLKPMDPKDRAARLSEHHYGLLPAFLNGMLDGAGPDVAIIDGNEGAYYYTDSRQYLSAYHQIAQRGLVMIDPALWPKYRAQLQVGQALYIDQYFGLRTRKTLGNYMEPPDQARWFEHNVFWSLRTADRYVWCYSERMNWWKNTAVPPGCEQAIRSARAAYESGEYPAFDIESIIEAAGKRERGAMAGRADPRAADIRRIPPNAPTPEIDGQLDDDAWKRTKPLQPFVALLRQSNPGTIRTVAWVTYDDRALYVAIRCDEPRPDRMDIHGEKDGDQVWRGDDVEIMVAAPGKTTPYYHFMVNPRGVAWNGIQGDSLDLNHKPEWRRAATIGKDHWSVELAIPWSSMKMSPARPGEKLRANLCRQRVRGARQYSTWSPMVNGFLEPDMFGTWSFR